MEIDLSLDDDICMYVRRVFMVQASGIATKPSLVKPSCSVFCRQISYKAGLLKLSMASCPLHGSSGAVLVQLDVLVIETKLFLDSETKLSKQLLGIKPRLGP